MTNNPSSTPSPPADRTPDGSPTPRASLRDAGERWSYFGWAERPYFRKMSQFRYDLFGRFLRPLADRGVRPNHITAASFLTVLVAFPLFYGAGMYGAAFVALAVHILLDGLDGPLAKVVGKKNTAQGALMDMSNDVTGIVIVVFTVSFFGPIPWLLGTVYAVTYLYLTIFAVAQNLLDLRYAYVVKTKYAVYGLLVVWWLTGLDLVSPMIAIATVYMGVSAFFGFIRVARALR